jgi:Rod binding domain-containing protein
MKAGSTQLPTELLLGRTSQALKTQRGQMPRAESVDANQAAVGKAFEEMLLREMVKAMQKTLPEGGLMPSGPSKGLYEHMMQQAMVENLSGSGGLGISEALDRAQTTLKRTASASRPPQIAVRMERGSESNDSVEARSSTTNMPDLSTDLPPQDDSWIDSPFAESHLRRLLSAPSDRKNSPFPFKK